MAEPARGLGIFDCPLWSHSSMDEQEPYPQTTHPPNIIPAAYDPFSEYPNNSNMMSAVSDDTPGLVYCQTPPSTNMPSHRSSVSSSCSPPQHHAEFYTPHRVKAEESHGWYPSPENEQVLQRSLTTQSFSPYTTGVTALSGSTEDLYRTSAGDWAKPAPATYPMEIHTSHHNMGGDDLRARFDSAHVLPSAHRIKKKRQRTTPEEATHDCKTCGKLFKRSYNWKSHMETHNPDRKYPHRTLTGMSTVCISKRRITDATFVAIVSLEETLSGGKACPRIVLKLR